MNSSEAFTFFSNFEERLKQTLHFDEDTAFKVAVVAGLCLPSPGVDGSAEVDDLFDRLKGVFAELKDEAASEKITKLSETLFEACNLAEGFLDEQPRGQDYVRRVRDQIAKFRRIAESEGS